MTRKRKRKLGNYRSEFELDVGQKLQPCGFSYEPFQIPYTVHRKYTPDFVYDAGHHLYHIECKGFFRVGDTQKYKAIVDSLSDTEELIFILMKPNQKVSKTTKLSMAQWCDKYNIKWYTIETLEELINHVSDT